MQRTHNPGGERGHRLIGVIEVVLTIAAAVIIAFPLLLLARRNTPGAARAIAG